MTDIDPDKLNPKLVAAARCFEPFTDDEGYAGMAQLPREQVTANVLNALLVDDEAMGRALAEYRDRVYDSNRVDAMRYAIIAAVTKATHA